MLVSDPQEDNNRLDFQKWKEKWNKDYSSPVEDNTSFEYFKENLRAELVNHRPPSGEPLWDVLNELADRPIEEHYGYIRLDRNLLDDDDPSDDEHPNCHFWVFYPVKQDDGTICVQKFYPPNIFGDVDKFVQEEIERQRLEKEDTKVKHQSTVPPVKRTSDDKDDTKEEDTVKRQKIGCGGQKQGCCSDCGK